MNDTPETPEVEDLMRYDVLAQEALRGVVKKVLQEVSRTGLPGEHHFYITFDTNHAGVRLSTRMKEKYPEEMTIVVQHQFWDLEATDMGFSIGLSFDNIPETMRVPYSAILGFFDPAVQFGLQFDSDIVQEDESIEEADSDADADADTIESLPASSKVAQIAKPKSKGKTKPKSKKPSKDTKTKIKSKTEKPADDAGSAEVVSLDAFRKK